MPVDRKARGARSLLEALHQASLAVAEVRDPANVYRVTAAALRDRGYHVNIYELAADGRARLRYFTYANALVSRVEGLTGLSASSFHVTPSAVPLFEAVLECGETHYVADTREVLRHIVPRGSSRLAGFVAGLLGIGRLIAAPIRVGGLVTGMLVVLSDSAEEEDMIGVEAFAHLLGRMLARAKMVQELEESVRRLEHTQARLVHAQKMEAVGHLTAGIAHEFNNLLTPAMFSLDTLTDNQDPEARQEAVQMLSAALDRAARLTRQLLAFGRKQVLSVRAVDANRLVEDMVAMLGPALGESVNLEVRLDADHSVVLADRGQVEQVLTNLALNARDALEPGGQITISTHNAQKRLAGHKGVASEAFVLTVADNGQGMTPSVQEVATEPFFTTKARQGGTGLGLAVVHGIVEQHGGLITIDSEPGQGTRVEVWLPATQTSVPAAPAAGEAQSLRLDGQLVWLLEDNHEIRKLLARALRTWGAEVAEAATLSQARELLSRTSRATPRLLVTDVVLPDGTGIDFADEVSQTHPTTAIVVISGHPLDDRDAKRLDVVTWGYLAKPFLLQEMKQIINELLRPRTRP